MIQTMEKLGISRRILHRKLDQGPVDDRQQLFRRRLGRWKDSGTESGDRKDCGLDGGHQPETVVTMRSACPLAFTL